MDRQTLIDAFGDCFQAGGSNRIQCGACGRIHFDSTRQGDWEEGEVEELTAAVEKDPDRYTAHVGFVHWVMYDGVVLVSDCPCGQVEKTATALWNMRRPIAEFLKRATMIQKREADADAASIGQLETGGG